VAELARNELDSFMARVLSGSGSSILEDVRARLAQRLARDATLERVARDLRLSARTLQRKLGELGASFQALLEEVRRERAHRYLSETDEPVDEIAARLGYGDPRTFAAPSGAGPAWRPRAFARSKRAANERQQRVLSRVNPGKEQP
jgi:AraC-like DNA-binding protein